jgi:hypothetical protein
MHAALRYENICDRNELTRCHDFPNGALPRDKLSANQNAPRDNAETSRKIGINALFSGTIS